MLTNILWETLMIAHSLKIGNKQVKVGPKVPLEEIALKQGSWFTGGQQVLIAWKRLFCGSPIFYEPMLYMKCLHIHILEGRTCDKISGKYWIIEEQDPVSIMQDFVGRLFLIPGLVWSGKGYHLWMWSLWGSQHQPFTYVLGHLRHGDNRTNEQLGDPRASLLLTSDKTVFCKNEFDLP